MKKDYKKNNIEDNRKFISLLITLLIMILFVLSQYLRPFRSSLKYRFDNLSIYKWICSQPFAITENGYITMYSSPRYAFLGELQELITTCIFILLIIIMYFLISRILNFYNKKRFESGKKI